jgi:hypothetical protein
VRTGHCQSRDESLREKTLSGQATRAAGTRFRVRRLFSDIQNWGERTGSAEAILARLIAQAYATEEQSSRSPDASASGTPREVERV